MHLENAKVCFFKVLNPLTHDHISKHGSSMKLHTQVEGQNTTQSSLELFKIYPRVTELCAPVRYRTKKKSVISM